MTDVSDDPADQRVRHEDDRPRRRKARQPTEIEPHPAAPSGIGPLMLDEAREVIGMLGVQRVLARPVFLGGDLGKGHFPAMIGEDVLREHVAKAGFGRA